MAPAAQPRTVTSPDEPTPRVVAALGALGLLLVAAVAVALRLLEPLTNGVMAAQDPYMHLAHTRSVLESGRWPVRDWGGLVKRPHYPPGLHALFGATVAVTGWPRYEAARFFPAAVGALAAAASFFLAERALRGWGRSAALAGGLVAATFMATTPELVFRSNLLQPSTVDLHLVPLLLLGFVAAVHGGVGSRLGWAVVASLTLLALLFLHPWVAGLMAPPLALYVLLDRDLPWRVRIGGAFAAGAGALAGLAFLLLGNYFLIRPERTLARLGAIGADPAGELLRWPQMVDYPSAVGWPLGVAAALGALVALRWRRGGAALGLAVTALLLPLTRVDWLGLWYLPHRTIMYLAVGLAVLAGVAAAGAVVLARARLGPTAGRVTAALVVLVVLAAGVPTGAATGKWYHLYEEPDHGAAAYLSEHADHVILGSWEGRWLVRAMTDVEWSWARQFFHDATARNDTLAALTAEGKSSIHMLIDEGVWIGSTGRRGTPYDLEFRREPEWKLVYEVEGVLIYAYDAEGWR